jgi:hypothetical protein
MKLNQQLWIRIYEYVKHKTSYGFWAMAFRCRGLQTIQLLRGEGVTHVNNPRPGRPIYLSFNVIAPKTWPAWVVYISCSLMPRQLPPPDEEVDRDDVVKHIRRSTFVSSNYSSTSYLRILYIVGSKATLTS